MGKASRSPSNCRRLVSNLHSNQQLRRTHERHTEHSSPKKYAGNALIQENLDAVSNLLAALELSSALELLDGAAPAGDYDVDANGRFVWCSAFGAPMKAPGAMLFQKLPFTSGLGTVAPRKELLLPKSTTTV
jgi:hypothetical protein